MKKILCILLSLCVTAGVVSLTACGGGTDANATVYDVLAIYEPDERTVTGTVDLNFYNSTDNELSDLKFNLYGNAFREDAKYKPVSQTYENKAYYAGKSYGAMEITGVENCGGWTVGGEDENLLIVNLTEPVYPEERVKVTVNYTLTLAQVNHRTGVTAKTVNLGNFYPRGLYGVPLLLLRRPVRFGMRKL